MPEIIWRGNEHTNKSSRKGELPFIIVDHIVEGTWQSCDSWFRSTSNKDSSATFCVAKNGTIRQYVKIEDAAWANGVTVKRFPSVVSAELIKEKGAGNSVNRYTISIEHEGVYEQTKGELTEAQYQATLWLHKYIKDYIKKVYGYDMPLDRKHIIGHYEIDKVNKPNCPGQKFPFDRLIKDLNDNSFSDVIRKFVNKGIISDAAYWFENCQEGKFVEGQYMNKVILRFVAMFKIVNTFEQVINVLKDMSVINSPDYWLGNAVDSGKVKGEYAKQLLIKMVSKF